jgi:ribosomal protein S18 acetylase RimI-like enzyme
LFRDALRPIVLDTAMRLSEPHTETEWSLYYDLRWRVLRAPWGQPRGSERDEHDHASTHLLVLDPAGNAVGAGRLHFNSLCEAQVRFMAVNEEQRGQGIGSAILRELERRAWARGANTIVLDARESAVGFYTRHGYEVVGAGRTLFGSVNHQRMRKAAPGPPGGSPAQHP